MLNSVWDAADGASTHFMGNNPEYQQPDYLIPDWGREELTAAETWVFPVCRWTPSCGATIWPRWGPWGRRGSVWCAETSPPGIIMGWRPARLARPSSRGPYKVRTTVCVLINKWFNRQSGSICLHWLVCEAMSTRASQGSDDWWSDWLVTSDQFKSRI